MAKKQRARRSFSESIESTAAGFAIRLSPVGISRAGHGSFWVGLCFCAGIAILATCFAVFPHLGATHKGVYVPPTHQPMPWFAWAFIAFFGVVSVAITLFGLSLGTRKAVIELAGETLRIEEKGFLSSHCAQWTRNELKAIQTGPSGFSVGGTAKRGRSATGGKSIQQLHVYLADGQRLRFLTGRDADELDWVAEQLRNGLSLTMVAYDGG
jgi:hypothetical protein